jgi:hypothetical protein
VWMPLSRRMPESGPALPGAATRRESMSSSARNRAARVPRLSGVARYVSSAARRHAGDRPPEGAVSAHATASARRTARCRSSRGRGTRGVAHGVTGSGTRTTRSPAGGSGHVTRAPDRWGAGAHRGDRRLETRGTAHRRVPPRRRGPRAREGSCGAIVLHTSRSPLRSRRSSGPESWPARPTLSTDCPRQYLVIPCPRVASAGIRR